MIEIKPSVRGENRCFSGGRIISLGSAEAGFTGAEYSVVNTVINREVLVSPHIVVFFDSPHSYFSNLSSHTGGGISDVCIYGDLYNHSRHN